MHAQRNFDEYSQMSVSVAKDVQQRGARSEICHRPLTTSAITPAGSDLAGILW